MESLKNLVPLGQNSARHTTLGLLIKAKNFIKVSVERFILPYSYDWLEVIYVHIVCGGGGGGVRISREPALRPTMDLWIYWSSRASF